MKTVFVTGASGGIGEAVAKIFAGNGYFVGVGYNTNREKAENLAKKINGGVKRLFAPRGQTRRSGQFGGYRSAYKNLARYYLKRVR